MSACWNASKDQYTIEQSNHLATEIRMSIIMGIIG